MRSFGAVIVHIASGNIYAGKAGKGGPRASHENLLFL
jgi:hypothetical protein